MGEGLRGMRASFQIGGRHRPAPLWIVGPDVIEDEGFTLEVAHALAEVATRRGLSLLFKASYEKANRSRGDSFRGPGIDRGLEILARVRGETGLPVTSDVHTAEEARRSAEVLDVVQIPAFLSRQNALLEAAAEGGRTVNLKKGQFLAPSDVPQRVEVLRRAGAGDVWITERGVSFGYLRLVNDLRVLPAIRATGAAAIFDATHSVQSPGGGVDGSSGGERSMIPILARAAVAAGFDGFFFEVHPDPERALCDGPNALPLDRLEALFDQLEPLACVVREIPDLEL